MRNLADLKCPQCGREFYGDLLAGQGLFSPLLLEKATGVVHDKYGVPWFADWLRDSYANRVNSPIDFVVEDFRLLKQPVVLNCLDTVYGHCLLKLLNAQYYLDHHPDLDLVVLVPRFLRWMVPEGVAAIWTVGLPLKRGIEWNDWLAAEIKHRIEPLEVCWLSVAFSHPHPADYDIERFTRVRLFPIDQWSVRLERPTVTFVWRDDRVWGVPSRPAGRIRDCIARSAAREKPCALAERRRQFDKVLRLATVLREHLPHLDFAVAGLGHPHGFPSWIRDMRLAQLDEAAERRFCVRYAQSHVVIGTHGSNMLLPSAHAGAVVELMPPERWGNILQDLLFRDADCRETMLRYRIIPTSMNPDELAALVLSLLREYKHLMLGVGRRFSRHGAEEVLSIPRMQFL
jgi:hypothetical protein